MLQRVAVAKNRSWLMLLMQLICYLQNLEITNISMAISMSSCGTPLLLLESCAVIQCNV